MRGAVSLAAALSLPLTTDAGTPLPDRDIILFVTFVVILVTIVGQGLTLPVLLRKLNVQDDDGPEQEEVHARLVIAKAALTRLDELREEDWTREDTIDRISGLYRFRLRRFKVRAGKLEDDEGIEERSLAYQRLMHSLFDAQREALVDLRNRGELSAEIRQHLEHELDLEESRLEV